MCMCIDTLAQALTNRIVVFLFLILAHSHRNHPICCVGWCGSLVWWGHGDCRMSGAALALHDRSQKLYSPNAPDKLSQILYHTNTEDLSPLLSR